MNCPQDTNPKSRHGAAKPGIHAIPPVALLHCGGAMDDGCEKYGLTNWREHEVSASVYYNAAFRHLAAWWDGEQVAADSGVHHLGHVMACCAILLDAEHMGQLIDDRPEIAGSFSRAVEAMTRALEGAAPILEKAGKVKSETSANGGWGKPLGLTDAEEAMLDEVKAPRTADATQMVVAYAMRDDTGTVDDRMVYVPIREDISSTNLDNKILEFLAGSRGASRLGAFTSFRAHIGCQNHSEYSPRNRTRLAFYMEARMGGVSRTAVEMDEDLRLAGFEFGGM